MKNHFIAALALTAAATASAEAATTFHANLTPEQSGNAGKAVATGFAKLVLNDAQDALWIFLSVDGITLDRLNAAHIHNAPAGSVGGVVFGFLTPNNDENGDLEFTDTGTGFTLSTIWDANEGNNTTLAAQLGNLFAGDLYFNLHTGEFPSGEIRGQVSAVPLPAAGLLMMGGIAALGFASRRKAKA